MSQKTCNFLKKTWIPYEGARSQALRAITGAHAKNMIPRPNPSWNEEKNDVAKNTNFKTHRVIANDVFLSKKDCLGSHRTIRNYRFLTKKGTPSGANCELNPHAGWSADPPGTPAGSSFPIENHRSAGAADAASPRDADCVAGPYIPRRKDRREVPYLPQIRDCGWLESRRLGEFNAQDLRRVAKALKLRKPPLAAIEGLGLVWGTNKT